MTKDDTDTIITNDAVVENSGSRDRGDDDDNNSASSALPTFWCKACNCDCTSRLNFAVHIMGRKHRNRAKAQGIDDWEFDAVLLKTKPTTTTATKTNPINNTPGVGASYWCAICSKNISKEAMEHHRNFDEEHLKKFYKLRNIDYDENVLHEALQATAAAQDGSGSTTTNITRAQQLQLQRGSSDDIDYSQVHDTERMLQTEYDDAVVELALYNYESYHAMKHGSVTYAMVNNTSAGIVGWAASSFGDVKVDDDNHKQENEEEDDDEDCKPAAATAAASTITSIVTRHQNHKGDKEEEQSLRIAMMESMLESRGVRSARSHYCDESLEEEDDDDAGEDHNSDDDDDDCSYRYDDEEEDADDCSCQQDDDEDDGGDYDDEDSESEDYGEENSFNKEEQEDKDDSNASVSIGTRNGEEGRNDLGNSNSDDEEDNEDSWSNVGASLEGSISIISNDLKSVEEDAETPNHSSSDGSEWSVIIND